MKEILLSLLAIIIIFTFASCSGGGGIGSKSYDGSWSQEDYDGSITIEGNKAVVEMSGLSYAGEIADGKITFKKWFNRKDEVFTLDVIGDKLVMTDDDGFTYSFTKDEAKE